MVLSIVRFDRVKLTVILLFSIVGLSFTSSIIIQALAVSQESKYSQSSFFSSSGDEFNFTELGRWNVEEGSYASNVAIDDNIAYVCASNQIAILDVADPTAPTLLGKFEDFGNESWEIPYPTSVIPYGDYIFVTVYWHDEWVCWTHKILVLDVSDPSNPFFVFEFNRKRLIYDIFLVDNYLYVSSSSEIRIFDINNPSYPAIISSFRPDGFFPSRIGVANSTVFMGSYANGFLVYNYSNIVFPELIRNYTDFSITSIVIEGSLAYAKTRPYNQYGFAQVNLTILNISNPNNVEVINQFPISDGDGWLSYYKGYIYFNNFRNYVKVLNVTNPDQISIVKQLDMTNIENRGYSIFNNYFYLTISEVGLIIYEVNYPPITRPTPQISIPFSFTIILTFFAFIVRRMRKT